MAEKPRTQQKKSTKDLQLVEQDLVGKKKMNKTPAKNRRRRKTAGDEENDQHVEGVGSSQTTALDARFTALESTVNALYERLVQPDHAESLSQREKSKGRPLPRSASSSDDDAHTAQAPLHRNHRKGRHKHRTRDSNYSRELKRSRREKHDYTSHSSLSSSEEDSDIDPRQLLSDSDARRTADRALSRQYRTVGKPKGKRHAQPHKFPRPNTFLPPDLRKRARARPEGNKLTLAEYICGYTRMMMSLSHPKDSKDMNSMLTHLANIAEDAATLKWPAVCDWTEACFDHMEDGHFTWSNHQAFASERMRLSWLHGQANDNNALVPCPAYNADGCDSEGPHSEGHYTLKHVCAVCMYGVGLECAHTAKQCLRKKSMSLRPHIKNEREENGYRHQFKQSRARETFKRKDYLPEATGAKN